MRLLPLLLLAPLVGAAEAPLYVFDNGLGSGPPPVEQQVQLARRTGYAGIFYNGTKNIPQLVRSHRAAGLRVLGIYTGMDVSAARPGYDPGLPQAIRDLEGTRAPIAFYVAGEAADGDVAAVPVIRDVAELAAKAGLKVALYPHHGMHVARIEDALRLCKKVGRKNVGIVFNLCHWLRSGDEPNMVLRLKEALPRTLMVSINGADHEGDWDRLIQPLDRGAFDVRAFVRTVRAMGYRGPFGLQCYNIAGDPETNLRRSIEAWRAF